MLTEQQQRVVEHRGGPLLVVGRPGSGKTRALEERYLRLASSEGLAPHRILILATNRRYAMEAKDRLVWALPHRATVEVPVYTWHALAYHLVSRYYPFLGYREPPVLLTAPEQWGVVRELLASEHRLDWSVWGERLGDRGFIDEVADFCLRVEQRMMEPGDLQALEARSGWGEVVRFYRRYQEFLAGESRLDYAGLISAAVRLLQSDEEVRERLRSRFPHVLVDEGEEMSLAHRELLRRLETANLVVAADPDCGIEVFRGAEPDWVFALEKWFGPHQTVILPRSHRLGEPLASHAGALMAQTLGEAGDGSGPLPADHETAFECRLYASVAEEVDAVARELRRLHLMGQVPWQEMAVLVSQPSYLLGPLQRALRSYEVPYLPLSSERPLSSEPPVGWFLDLVRVAMAGEGWEGLLPNLLTSPLVGLDYAARRRLERLAWQERRSLAEMAEEAPEAAEFRALRDLVVEHWARADECFWQVYRASSYCQRLAAAAREASGPAATAELDALVALSHALGRFVERRHGRGSIVEYLEEASRADFGGDPWLAPAGLPRGAAGLDRVALVSFHAAKGREWEVVVVAGCLDTWIPKGRRARGLFDPLALEISEIADREVEAIADDRRTFYVAATRARRKAIFTVSSGPGGRGRPSRFLVELAGAPPESVSTADPSPVTLQELRGRLRRVVRSEDKPPEEKVAALIALSEMPGIDPQRWYGRVGWSEGAVPIVATGDFKTSYSRLSVYDNCPLQYLLQCVLGLDATQTHSMKFGTWMHALFRAVHAGVIAEPAILLAEYARLFDERVFPNATIARQYRRDGEKMLETFWRYEVDARTVRAEHPFSFPFAGAMLRGRIDRVDKMERPDPLRPHLKLTDYKTSRWAGGIEEARDSLQLAIYYLAARTSPDLKELGEPIAARLVYPGATLADGKPIERVQNASDAERVIEGLPDLIARVLSEDFRPSPEADCTWCQMKPLCPLWPQGRELSP